MNFDCVLDAHHGDRRTAIGPAAHSLLRFGPTNMTMEAVRRAWIGLFALLAAVVAVSAPAAAQQQQRPNIVMIMGDDIGMWNIGAYHHGIMAGRTPNIDQLAVRAQASASVK
jgi:hypothetical protein